MMSYSQWTKLSEIEAEQKQTLEIYLAREATEEAFQLTQTLDLETIIKFACLSGQLKQFFNQAICTPLWQQHIRVFDNPSHGYQASFYQPLSAFDSLFGYCLFSLSIQARQANDGKKYQVDEMVFLQRSAEVKCYRAYEELMRRGSHDFAGSTFLSGNANALLQPALQASTHHWTPGFILLFDAYYLLGVRTNNHFSFHEAWVALKVAENLSTHSHSQNAMANANAGRGSFSRCLAHIDDFADGLSKVAELGKLRPNELETCSLKAKRRAESYQNSLQDPQTAKNFYINKA